MPNLSEFSFTICLNGASVKQSIPLQHYHFTNQLLLPLILYKGIEIIPLGMSSYIWHVCPNLPWQYYTHFFILDWFQPQAAIFQP